MTPPPREGEPLGDARDDRAESSGETTIDDSLVIREATDPLAMAVVTPAPLPRATDDDDHDPPTSPDTLALDDATVSEPPHRPRRAIGAWLAPTPVVAVGAATVAGLVDGLATASDPIDVAGTVGFAALLALPVLVLGGLIARGLIAAWRPHLLARHLVDRRGAAPRLAAWSAYLTLAAFVLSWATFNSIRWLALVSSFKPVVISLSVPLMVLGTAGLLAIASRPLVDAMAAGFARLERRRARRQRRPLTTPATILGGVLVVVAGAVILTWFLTYRPRLGHFEVGIFAYPVIAIACAALGHRLWDRRAGARRGLAIAAGALVAVMVGAIAFIRATDPVMLLDLWSRPTVAGLAIDELFDLDEIRSEMTLTAFRPAARPGAPHPDVILITIDTVRADRTPLHGGTARMPVLAALGARGAVFDWALSPGNVTRRSIPSIALGLSPTRVRGRVAGWALRLDPRHVLLAERFAAAGYETAGFFCCASFWGPEHKLGINRGLQTLHIDPNGAQLAVAARDWLRARDKAGPRAPLFLWIHFLEPHNWNRDRDELTITPDDRRRYDDVLGQVDHFLGEVMTGFDQRGPAAQPLVIVTADHGEGLGDHDAPYHSSDLYESQIHVPLVIAGPGVKARRIGETIGLVDLAPTLLDLAGFVPPGMPEMDGRSVADLVTGARPGDPAGGRAFAAQVRDRSVATDLRAFVDGKWKVIDTGAKLELYDLRADPNELHDLATERPQELARLKGLLEAHAAIDDVSPFP
ncbi:MAG: sulfatase-like hydrolase/transferase [Deltaproteobacteria bacterium]|nr:sulfatase-like hydrolase/transferase [Deltaproteobacteria bacterium]